MSESWFLKIKGLMSFHEKAKNFWKLAKDLKIGQKLSNMKISSEIFPKGQLVGAIMLAHNELL